MNVHHLELFYYVAKHGGIMPAVRNIPYGIQQPAVSAQVAQLEEFLGVTLFQRRPFALTPPGEKLYAFVKPFFSNVDKVANDLQGGQARHPVGRWSGEPPRPQRHHDRRGDPDDDVIGRVRVVQRPFNEAESRGPGG